MGLSEAIAEKLLKNKRFRRVVYEPDGNVPPDFLAEGRIAVEVRRLNQNHHSGNEKRGLEETEIPLWDKIEKLCHSFGAATNESWFLSFRFSRPVKPWRQLKPRLRNALDAFKDRPHRKSGRVYTEDHFELEVIRSSKTLYYYFCMGGSGDYQSGGCIVAEMLKNIEHCAMEKSQKIFDFRSNYPVWLVLIDHIGLGIGEHDEQQLLAHAKRPAYWDKIVVVNPLDPTDWFEF